MFKSSFVLFAKFEPSFPKKINRNNVQQQANRDAFVFFQKFLNKWNKLPFKIKMYLAGSTFVVSFLADYVSGKVFEKAQIREEAERMVDMELQQQNN